MFVKTDKDWINLYLCRQIEIIESSGKNRIYLRSGVVPGNEMIKSTFTISGFDTKEDAQQCVDSILQAFKNGEKVWEKPIDN